jgi:hypothetical protein
MKSEKFYLLINSSLLLAQLTFLFVIKYSNQGLSLSNFSLAKTGNIFNLLVYIGIILGMYILVKKKEKGDKRKDYFYLCYNNLVLVDSFIPFYKSKNHFKQLLYFQPVWRKIPDRDTLYNISSFTILFFYFTLE